MRSTEQIIRHQIRDFGEESQVRIRDMVDEIVETLSVKKLTIAEAEAVLRSAPSVMKERLLLSPVD